MSRRATPAPRGSDAAAVQLDTPSRVTIAGTAVDLMSFDDALRIIEGHWNIPQATPLAVCSVNLDHIHHFGHNGRWHGTGSRSSGGVEWLNLIDGAPIARKLERDTGASWPRLAGSDLIGPLLERVVEHGMRVGFLGGSPETHDALRKRLALERPALSVSGMWSPSARELADPVSSRLIAQEIAEAGTDVLVVCIGKPRQEVWIAEYGELTGARTLLAFGAVVDFLAGRIERAPRWVSDHGLEWAWRFALEPRRLAQRYLVQGPPAYAAVRRSRIEVIPLGSSGSTALPAGMITPAIPAAAPPADPSGTFAGPAETAEVTVVTVTYNSASHIDALIASLRVEARTTRLRLVVADNSSTDDTVARLADQPDITIVRVAGNVGYAGGINAALGAAGASDALLVLNPDLTVEPGAVRALLGRMDRTGAGIVVPAIRDSTGAPYPSLRREPTVTRSLGDALWGERWRGRGARLSEIDWDTTSYDYPHRIDWATGAALLIRRDLADRLGPWDERFFLYSEETEYFHRARKAGETVWFTPDAIVRHEQGGSGVRPEFTALMAVNRVRYARATSSPARVFGVHAVAVLHAALRANQPAQRAALKALLRPVSWESLPHATSSAEPTQAAQDRQQERADDTTAGSIIIPAHNEEAVIRRTLRALAPAIESGSLEVIVACNGCTDGTAHAAGGHPNVRVLDLAEPSKPAALNAGDRAATRWPRMYLDADIEISPGAVAAVFGALQNGGALAARPGLRYDTAGADPLVRAYYRARVRAASPEAALWGAGAYAVSEDGHRRFTEFPALIADDLWIDGQFADGEKLILPTTPAIVRTPRTSRDLAATLRRVQRGNAEVGGTTPGRTLRRVMGSVRGPLSAADALVYIVFALVARRPARVAQGWERDASSRSDVR